MNTKTKENTWRNLANVSDAMILRGAHIAALLRKVAQLARPFARVAAVLLPHFLKRAFARIRTLKLVPKMTGTNYRKELFHFS